MEEQPRTEPARRAPAKASPRTRAAKATFRPPVAPAEPAADVGSAENTPESPPIPPKPRRRSGADKAAPAVLFQPPPVTPEPTTSPDVTENTPPPAAKTPSGRRKVAATPSPTTTRRSSPRRKVTQDTPPESSAPEPETPAEQTTTTVTAVAAEQTTTTVTAVAAGQPTTPATPAAVVAAQPLRQKATTRQKAAPVVAVTPPAAGLNRILAHPGYAPELLAALAVTNIGPRAQAWADRLREAYPEASTDGLARLATTRHVRLAGWAGGVAAVSGLLAPLTELVAVAWTQAALVLHLAAAHGRDAAHPDRAGELLVLTRIHPDLDSARAALAAAHAAPDEVGPPVQRLAEAGWRLAVPLAAQTGGWLGLRLAARLLPGAAVLATVAGNTAAAQRLAARSTEFYRRPPG